MSHHPGYQPRGMYFEDFEVGRSIVTSRRTVTLRIPRDGGHDSTLMADRVPPSWRTPFHGDGGQHSILMADT
ncbi:MAG: hypothetical protein J0I00_08020 [Burkholderiales bacterium]|nr:hypothetical protein [Burkholderiales bacterium]